MMMDEQHQQIQDALAAYALNALDADTHHAVERHLEGCTACQTLLDEYEGVMGLLPYALPSVAPSPDIKARLLAEARASKPTQWSTPPTLPQPIQSRPTPPRPRVSGRPVWQWAAVAAVLIALVGWNITLQQQLGQLETAVDVAQLATVPQGEVIALVGSGQAGASARLYLAATQQDGVLAIAGLPELPPDRVYQLWFAQPDHPTTTGGAFRVNHEGEALVAITVPYDLDVVSAIAVTEEAAPGVERPTTPHLLDGMP